MPVSGIDWTKATEVKVDSKDILLRKLNNGDDLFSSDTDISQVNGGFLSSRNYPLHDGKFKKTIATAFHIPKHDTGEVHHYIIDIYRFRRAKTTEQWGLEPVERLDQKEIEKLKEFFGEQDAFIGKTPTKRFHRIIASDSVEALSDLDRGLNFILSPENSFDITQMEQEQFEKILNLITKVVEGKNLILEKELYDQLRQSRTSGKKVEEYKNDLIEFKSLIESSETTETDIQNFLENRVWFFGLNYVQSKRNSKPKFGSGLGSQYDFLLEGFNQVYDIVELKGPNDELFELDSSGERTRSFDDRTDYRFSQKFSRALHQVMLYMQEFEESFGHIKEQQPSIQNFMYPKGTIVLSKRSLFPKTGRNSQKYLHLANRQFANVDILTYDDLADRAQIIINFIEGDDNT
ncbi:MAG: hypothetical protein COV59_02090 [Candidatus Magasanikbacteria bacterium CG11_big_fil_rev_8_21_14_0_20_39_34]|uniref:Shedu protein SduA C-terminal domain-containing protein n=1 Tax=Candidatus Magasanikbacteria bacterium CG11_big_fil_rev_8_21_14_0_20_39_34 TaxID=1974653 RepID=A0A2H0N4Y8_9BACT|nr:MAG: hypothetical protein COV59_02090 [Candidatus Magasanikbacteria bacterium CG11_big_fil_rev_8_21_14_0_20_39_34]